MTDTERLNQLAKELLARLDELNARCNALEARVKTLEAVNWCEKEVGHD